MPSDYAGLHLQLLLERLIPIVRQHGKNAAVGTQHPGKRFFIQAASYMAAEVIDHARQRDIEVRHDVSRPCVLFDDSAQRHNRFVALVIRERAHRQDPVEDDEHKQCGEDGQDLPAAPGQNGDNQADDNCSHRRTARAVTEQGARELLNRTKLEESASGDLVRLVTPRSGSSMGQQLEVRYEVRVPPSIAVNLTTVNGKVELEGVTGAVALETVNGGVEARGVTALRTAETVNGSSGLKTRKFDHILSELEQAFDIHRRLNSQLGGVHFELTGENVTECTGGARNVKEADLKRAYRSHVDPRLNYEQALEMAMSIARRFDT